MKHIALISLLLLACISAFAQDSVHTKLTHTDNIVQDKKQKTDSLRQHFTSKFDSLRQHVPGDSLAKANLHKADSIQSAFYKKADSLQSAYQKPLNKIDSASSLLQHKIDSLQTLHLPATGFTRKLDSLQNVRTQKVSELNTNMDKLKSKAMTPLKEITLPPQMQEPLNKLTGSINGYKLAGKGMNLPGMSNPSLPGMNKVDIPGINNPKLPGALPQTGNLNLPTDLNKITQVSSDLKGVTQAAGQAGGYVKDAKSLATGNVDEVKHLDKTAENQVMKLDGAGEMKSKSAELDKLKQTGGALKNPDSLKEKGMVMAKQQAMVQVKKAAVNHFAGQEQVLQSTMSQMTKVKAKYSEVKSLSSLPKKVPNPLKGKPLIERIVPALTFQIQKSNTFLLDVNPLAYYKFTPKWSAGAGWNYRFAIHDWNLNKSQSIYGPRAVVEYKLKRGFNLRIQPEVMNAFVPTGRDYDHREWVWGMFAGVKKEFVVHKKIMGNTEVLYNLLDRKNISPYADKVSIRFGFEFPMKKKVKSTKQKN